MTSTRAPHRPLTPAQPMAATAPRTQGGAAPATVPRPTLVASHPSSPAVGSTPAPRAGPSAPRLPLKQGLLPWYSFRDQLDAIFRGDLPVHQLVSQLSALQASLAQPLLDAPRSSQHRQELQSGKAQVAGQLRTLAPAFVDVALRLSDALELDEFRAAELVQWTLEEARGHYVGLETSPDATYKAALAIYHSERRDALLALVTLMRGRADEGISIELRTEILLFTDRLIHQGGLLDHLLGVCELDTMQKRLATSFGLATPVGGGGAPHPTGFGTMATAATMGQSQEAGAGTEADAERRAQLEERYLAALVVFYALYCCYPDSTGAVLKRLLQVLRTSSTRLATAQASGAAAAAVGASRNTTHETAVTTLLVLTTCLALSNDELWSVEDQDYSRNPLVGAVDHQRALVALVAADQPWQHRSIQAVLQLRFSLFLTEVDSSHATHAPSTPSSRPAGAQPDDRRRLSQELWEEALKHHALRWLLTDLVQSTTHNLLDDEENGIFFRSVLDEMLVRLVTLVPARLRALKVAEETAAKAEAAYVQYPYGEKPHPPPTHWPDLLRLLAATYRRQPDLAAKWFEGGHHSPLQQWLRSAGEALTPTALPAYVKLLAALAGGEPGSTAVFHLLRTSSNQLVCWDHFFRVLGQYYGDLSEQQQRPGGGRGGGLFQQRQEIQVEEEAGLQAILELVGEVVRNCSTARNLFWEQAQWQVVGNLFGLLGCDVSSGMKAALLRALGAFAVQPELCAPLWDLLEDSDILGPDPQAGLAGNVTSSRSGAVGSHGASGGQAAAGISYELEEIESRNETYPQTIAFLELLELLARVTVPSDLGHGRRAPGVTPYLTFAVDHVLLPAEGRRYEEPSELWRVEKVALAFVSTLLAEYRPQPADFSREPIQVGDPSGRGVPSSHPRQQRLVEQQGPPGHAVMVALLSRSPLCRRLLALLGSGAGHLLEGSIRRVAFEECIVLALGILDHVISLQADFFHAARVARSGLPLVPLSALFLRDQRHIVQVSQLIGYQHSRQLALLATRILSRLGAADARVGRVLLASAESRDISAGIVYQLEVAEPMDVADDGSLRVAILRLLLDNVTQEAPNLTQWLCGFDVDSSDAWVSRHPSHAVVDGQLRSLRSKFQALRVVEALLTSHLAQLQPTVAELAIQLLHALVADPATSQPTIHFLRRRSPDFFLTCFQLVTEPAWPGRHAAQTFRTEAPPLSRADALPVLRLATSYAAQVAWLLRTVAVVLHTSHAGQKGPNQALLAMLYLREDALAGGQGIHSPVGERMYMLDLLDCVDFALEEVPPLTSPLFGSGLTGVLDACVDRRTEWQPYDLERLHTTLRSEQARLQGSTGLDEDTPDEWRREVQRVLQLALVHNTVRRSFHAHREAADAWRQVIEITLAGLGLLRQEQREQLLYRVLAATLQRVGHPTTRPALHSVYSGLALSLMVKMREHEFQVEAMTPARLVDTHLPVEQLLGVLRGLLGGLLQQGTSQVSRGTLYATLLNYLHHGSSRLRDGTRAQLVRAGAPLLHRIALDAAEGPAVWRAVALATLDALLVYDDSTMWLRYLVQAGYLYGLLRELQQAEPALVALLSPTSASLNQLYLYENRMSLLQHLVVNSREGASALLEGGIFQVLSEQRWVEQRPAFGSGLALLPGRLAAHGDAPGAPDWWPSLHERYHQLLNPLLMLVGALLTRLPESLDVANRALSFLHLQRPLWTAILSDKRPYITVQSLHELELVTAIMVPLARHPQLMLDRLGGELGRYEGDMVALLRRYSRRESWLPHLVVGWDAVGQPEPLLPSKARGDGGGRDEGHSEVNPVLLAAENAAQQICMNVLVFMRLLTDSPGRLMLQPSFEQSVPHSLAILAQYLSHSTATLFQVAKRQADLAYQLDTLSELPVEELERLAPSAGALVAPPMRLRLAELRLAELGGEQKKRGQALIHIIEHVLLLLHRHLERAREEGLLAEGEVSGASVLSGPLSQLGKLDPEQVPQPLHFAQTMARAVASALGGTASI